MEAKKGPSKEDRHVAWGHVLEQVLGNRSLTIAERAAYALLAVAEQDALDESATLTEIRRVIDRGLAGLKERGWVDQVSGEYRLIKAGPKPKAMAVDAEPEAAQPADAETEAPAPAVEV